MLRSDSAARLLAVAVLPVLAGAAATQAQLVPGDIVVTSYYGGLPAGVSKLALGNTSPSLALVPLSVNGQFANLAVPSDFDFTADGQVVVSVSQSRIVRVNPANGSQVFVRTVVGSGSEFIAGVTVGPDGNYYVCQRQYISSAQPTVGNIFRVPPSGATQQFISGRAPGFGPNLLQFPNQGVLSNDGGLLIADLGDVVREDGIRNGRILRIELGGTAGGTPNLGSQGLISPAPLPPVGTSTFSPVSIAITPAGVVYVADAGASGSSLDGGLYRVDTETGVRTLVATGGDFRNIAFDPFTGTILAVRDVSGLLVRVDPATGAQTTLVDFSTSGGAIFGVRVFGTPPATPPCQADRNLDGVVDGTDFVLFINSFAIGDATIDRTADLNSDSIIDGNDFVAFINAFALGC